MLCIPIEDGILLSSMPARRTKKAVIEEEVSIPTSSKSTSTSSKAVRRSSTPAFIAGVLITGIIVIVGAIVVGRSDKGEIDVNKAIEKSNQANRESGNTAAVVETVPDQFKDMPNGGLVPQEGQPPAEQQSSDTSTTTGNTASTTPAENSPTATSSATTTTQS